MCRANGGRSISVRTGGLKVHEELLFFGGFSLVKSSWEGLFPVGVMRRLPILRLHARLKTQYELQNDLVHAPSNVLRLERA